MTTHVELRRGAYADSVTLLQVSRTVQGLPGVSAAQVAMATPLNVEVLLGMGFEVPEEATTNDMVVAVRLDEGGSLDDVLAGVDAALRDSTRRREGGSSEVAPPRTTAAALRRAPGSVVVVSVPGENAFVEAVDAVEAGSDVLVFSDNVPVAQEVRLKELATERGRLVMGPDCGTAVLGGVGLGFANVVSPGPVGLVAASGTGCQQLLALLDHAGVGVTHALGVGGRDLSAEVGGRSTLTALDRLDADDDVELVVVVSKPPAPEVAAAVEQHAASLSTPVELALLGAGQPDLTEAAERILARLGREVPQWPVTGSTAAPSGGHRLRGLFVGGTLASEAKLLATSLLGGAAEGDHTFTDFGDDAYTTGRAHPMIDPTLRLEHLAQAAADPDTAVLLLDVVLGHGAEADPAAQLAPALAGVDKPVVVAVVGTASDPQGLERTVDALAAAGAEVHLSNARAVRRAVELVQEATR
ncbi:FdrA family protein [Nocardioides flavescens]|uniref:FdrA family protein n=1 Tax=Nocardioides flavescens TaxID=2691959 RepID=A0A6L7F018_9ACTN|nr:FdrA family protein [Nocardioides flavescens]MXG89651.1 FdrA family protein [Nocardioides flavescens]